MDTAVCSQGGVSQLRWFEVGLVVVGWVERTQVSRPGSKGHWDPMVDCEKKKDWPYEFPSEGFERMEEGLE